MKTTIQSIVEALVLLLAISCTKENNNIRPFPTTDKSLTQTITTDINSAESNASIIIGTQRWMTKDLNLSHYRNGDQIPEVKDQTAWSNLTTGAWCWYNNDSSIRVRLYNWYAVNDPRGLAPAGWHVPSDAEWTTLSTFLGGEFVAGGKMKEAGLSHWLAPNTDATNSSGFTGLPGGYRGNNSAKFKGIGAAGYWFSSTQYNKRNAWSRNLYGANGSVSRGFSDKQVGFTIRCLKD